MASNVSIMIPTLDEERNLPYALESCGFADRVYVLDSGSTDGTRRVAGEFGAEFVSHPWEGYARQKNWGLEHLPFATEWVFILDADEVLTPALGEEIVALATGKTATDCAGFFVNRCFFWDGRPIRHSGYYPSWNLRFFRRGCARYEEREVHEHMLVDGPVGYLRHEMRHEDRRGKGYLWQKHLKYADLEAREMAKILNGSSSRELSPAFFGNPIERRRAIKEKVWPYLPARWLLRFGYMYLLKRGFLDGRAGLDICLFMMRYEREIARNLTQRIRR